MLRLRIKAPFGAFRTFTAGSFRPTAPFISPSAAYGLLLNLAGIDSRFDDGKSSMTLMKQDLPNAEIALGLVAKPETQTIFQQLHNYPVGATGKERSEECKGSKYNIQPIRRAFLSGLDCYICLQNNNLLIDAIRSTLDLGTLRTLEDNKFRYGIPHLGDSNFMIDIIREETSPLAAAHWLKQADPAGIDILDESVSMCRLSIWINRLEMHKTVTGYFILDETLEWEPSEATWIKVGSPEVQQFKIAS